MELSELLYRMAMLARTKGDGISDGMQEDEFACSKHALESLGSLASVVRGEDDAQVFHYRIVQVLLSHENHRKRALRISTGSLVQGSCRRRVTHC